MGSWKVGGADTLAGWADPDFPLVGRGAQFGMCPQVRVWSCTAAADWPRLGVWQSLIGLGRFAGAAPLQAPG